MIRPLTAGLVLAAIGVGVFTPSASGTVQRRVRSPDRAGAAWGGSPIVFDGELWLIVVTADGAVWRQDSAPWSARGAPAVWVIGGKLFMAGGKYSVMENGAPRFIYRNDVWSMARQRR